MNYSKNINKLYALSVCTGLTFASALIVPFFNSKGLDQAQIMSLQTIFSLSVVLLEVPTGYVADRFSRVTSLKLGAVAVSIGFMGYAMSPSFAFFALCEIMLALGFALLSGADDALMYDSLLANNREGEYRSVNAKKAKYLFAVAAVGAPVGSLLASYFGTRPVLFLDGLMALVGLLFALKLAEPPMHKKDNVGRNPLADMWLVIKHSLRGHEVLPALILLSAALSASTYFGFWLAPVYFAKAGISLVWFGFIAAARNIVKALLSHYHARVSGRFSDRSQLLLYCSVSLVSYLLLAIFVHPIAAFFFVGFDVVQSLQTPVLNHKVQQLAESRIRAQVMSVMSLSRRGFYALSGPLVGLMIDKSLRLGMAFCLALFALFFSASLLLLKSKKAL